MNKNIIISAWLFVSSCLSMYAAAGFADNFNDRQHWIYPAYLYNLIFGVIVLFGIWCATMKWKSKSKLIIESISTYLRCHPIMAIISTGLLLSVPFALSMSLMWEILWFLALIPAFGLIILFPFLLGIKYCREKWILPTHILKWLIIFDITCCISSCLFILLTNTGILPNTEITYLARPNGVHSDFYSPTHPYDSLKEIWEPSLLFIAEIVIALGLFGFGKINDYLRNKLSAIGHRTTTESSSPSSVL